MRNARKDTKKQKIKTVKNCGFPLFCVGATRYMDSRLKLEFF
jgi:hypothetical protein